MPSAGRDGETHRFENGQRARVGVERRPAQPVEDQAPAGDRERRQERDRRGVVARNLVARRRPGAAPHAKLPSADASDFVPELAQRLERHSDVRSRRHGARGPRP